MFFVSICLSVSLSVCKHHYSKSYEWIAMNTQRDTQSYNGCQKFNMRAGHYPDQAVKRYCWLTVAHNNENHEPLPLIRNCTSEP